MNAAISYPLSFPEVSTVLLSAKNAGQASENFALTPKPLSNAAHAEIAQTQRQLGLAT